MSSSDLRKKFKEFFESKGHKSVPSSSLVPENDPTVLFTTAGMQQFKRYFLFPDEAPSARIVTNQKCVRTGDIDEVGDETHLTFFEMLGNFSFGYPKKEGSYFKKEAIELAWEFLTSELGIEKSRIYATYFKDDNHEVPEDVESLEILRNIEGLTDIRPQGFEDNFWSLGTEGSPGGPTVEFYVYPEQSRGVDGLPSEALAKDGVEIWNLVFNEFVLKNGTYEPVELKGVDTGMGLERLAVMMQGRSDVYQTDLFLPLINKIEEISNLKYGDKPDSEYEECWVETRKNMRIIADHIKAAVYLVADGVEPSNKDRGYVLRRLIRRAVVKARQLGIENSFCASIASVVIPTDGASSDEVEGSLDSARDDIKNVIEKEESKFRKTLEGAIRKLEIIKDMKIGTQWEHGKIDWKQVEVFAEDLFDLYQKDGLPLEVGIEEARRLNIPIAVKAFEIADVMKRIDEVEKDRMRQHQELSRTASAGMFKGGLADNKIETTRLHTAAHLLLAALREVLGEQVEQKGSNITEERLRFDFNHPDKLTPEQLEKVENIVNEKITEALPVTMQEMELEEAKKSGATGSFSDRYGNVVKIYTIGAQEDPFSREICGGPHVENTSELGHFKITKEESSSAGIRRIKAVLEE